MTSIPPSSTPPPGAGTTLSTGTLSPVNPAGASAATSQNNDGTGRPGSTPGASATASPEAAAADTIAPTVSGGSVVVATVIGSPRGGGGAGAQPSGVPSAPAGTQVSLRVAGVIPDMATATASASNGQLVATVVGRTPAGQTIIDTAIGRLAVNAVIGSDIESGAQIALDLVGIVGRDNPFPAAAQTLGSGLAGLGSDWPALKAALAALSEIDAPLAQQIMEIVLLRPDNPKFLGQILGLLARPASNLKALLGEAADDALRNAGRGDLVAHLDADLQDLARLNASATDWQVFYIPIVDTAALRQLRVYTRRRKIKGSAGDASSRFVVEVEFEQLGPLQIDGLVHKPRLDLIMRSHHEIPPALQAGIAGVFGQTCDGAGLIGKIFFQTMPAFPVSPLDEMQRHHGAGLSV